MRDGGTARTMSGGIFGAFGRAERWMEGALEFTRRVALCKYDDVQETFEFDSIHFRLKSGQPCYTSIQCDKSDYRGQAECMLSCAASCCIVYIQCHLRDDCQLALLSPRTVNPARDLDKQDLPRTHATHIPDLHVPLILVRLPCSSSASIARSHLSYHHSPEAIPPPDTGDLLRVLILTKLNTRLTKPRNPCRLRLDVDAQRRRVRHGRE